MARPDVFWGEITPCEHSVQIYDDDAVFLDRWKGSLQAVCGRAMPGWPVSNRGR
jgi:hypothetical protein